MRIFKCYSSLGIAIVVAPSPERALEVAQQQEFTPFDSAVEIKLTGGEGVVHTDFL